MNEGLGNGPEAAARVGYIIKMFPRLSETFILNEVLELEEQGLQLRTFSLKRPVDSVLHAETQRVNSPVVYLPEKISQAQLQIARGQVQVWRRFPEPWRHTLRNTWRRRRPGDVLAFCQACCIASELGSIRHLHAHYANVPAKVALLVQRLTGVSYSITTHAKDIFQNDPFGSFKLRERMYRASFVVANSEFSAEHIRSGLDGAVRIQVVRNGLDLASFQPREHEPAQPLVLGVGRLVEKKGFADFVSMCRALKERGVRFSAKIVGTGALSSALKEQIRSADVGDRIALAGPLPQEVLREVYRQAAVFVLPCKVAADGDRDILPNAIKEAMAIGVPVVTTRLEGIEELIEHGVSGLLVEPGDVASLAASAQALLGDAGLRKRLTRNARQVIEQRFDRRKNFAALKAALEESAACKPVTKNLLELLPATNVYGTSCIH